MNIKYVIDNGLKNVNIYKISNVKITPKIMLSSE